MYIYFAGHKDTQTLDRHTGGQTDRYGETDGQAAGSMQTGNKADRQADRKTDRQKDS